MELDPEILELLESEKQAFDEVLARLKDEFYRYGYKLRTQREHASILTKERVAARMIDDKQQLASDEAVSHKLSEMKRDELARIEVLLEEPYFARLILEEQLNGKTNLIEYKIGKSSNIDCRIIDWRKAPIAKLFYEYQEGEEYSELIQGREREGTITLRNKIEAKGGELKSVHCRYGIFDLVDGQWQSRGKRGGPPSTNSGGMPNILSLITAEQYDFITRDIYDPLLIQGIAGSGKTAVALHRLSWMLTEYRDKLDTHRLAVFSRSRALKNYMARSLSELGVSNLEIRIFDEWSVETAKSVCEKHQLSFQKQTESSPGGLMLKGSLALLSAIESYTEAQRERLLAFVEEKFANTQELPEVRHALKKLAEPRAPYLSIYTELLSQMPARAFSDEQAAEVADVLERLRNYPQDLKAIFRNSAVILDHDDSTLIDTPLLKDIYDEYSENLENNQLSVADASAIVFLHSLKSKAPGTSAHQTSSFQHAVVDEVQDYNALELATIMNSLDKRTSVTLAGDVSQEMSTYSSFPGWERLRHHWKLGTGESSLVTLSVSHRSTRENMRLAHYFLEKTPPQGGRKGKPPFYFLCPDEECACSEMIDWLKKATAKLPLATSAVICKHQQEARYVYSLLTPSFGAQVRIGTSNDFSFEEGIVVTDVLAVKGLEFPNVLLWNPSRESYGRDKQSRHMLYIAATRAVHNLCVVSAGNPSQLLPSVHSKIVRGFDRRED